MNGFQNGEGFVKNVNFPEINEEFPGISTGNRYFEIYQKGPNQQTIDSIYNQPKFKSSISRSNMAYFSILSQN